MLDQPAQSIVFRKVEKMPIEARVVGSLLPLTELAAHEEQLLARLPVHPPVKHSEVGELLPFVARHFRNERTFQMNDFIVTQHQNEMLSERVEERKRDVAVMKPSINRIERHVFQEVVHPTHVPFKLETETAEINRPRDAGPGG